jgi:uncharacterized Zn finger protein (UPF0148 family)
MPLFRPRKRCGFCGASIKQPKEGHATVCPVCGAPGPWSSETEIEAHRQVIAQKDREAKAAEERRHYEAELREFERLRSALELSPIEVPGFIAQKGEEAYEAMPAKLLEWKKQRGHYEGGSGFRGLSVRVPGTKSLRAYYGGLSQRQYVPGPEGYTQVDSGTAVITSKRVVFLGASKNVEWDFSKLVGLGVDRHTSAVVLQVTNRQKANVLQLNDVGVFETKLEAAIARFQGQPPPELIPPVPPSSMMGYGPLHLLPPPPSGTGP